MIVGMHHTGLTVGNLDVAMAFYGDALGIDDTHTQVSDQPYLAGVTGLPGLLHADPINIRRPSSRWR